MYKLNAASLFKPAFWVAACMVFAQAALAGSLQLGKQQSWRGLFQACDVIDGQELCAFHVQGWKFFAYYDEFNKANALNLMWELPLNLPVVLEGELISHGDVTAQIVLSGLRLDFEGDPYGELRKALQGLWRSSDDQKSSLEIIGSELRETYDGQFLSHEFLQISSSCATTLAESGPYLLLTDPENHENPRCFSLIHVDGERLELSYVGRGNTLNYRRE